MKLKLIYIVFTGMLLSLPGCVVQPETAIDPGEQNQPVVYLAMTRAQGSAESVNEDVTDYEDRVHDFALLVFDSSTGKKVGEYFESSIPVSEKSKTFTVKLTPGTRDFYFVANMAGVASLEGISNRDGMDTYMRQLRNLDTDLYLNAAEGKGFPMSRVYTNQTIPEGGSVYAPLPFRPGGEDRVKLVRALAKLEVKLTDSESSIVDNLYYHNAYRQYSLLQLEPLTSPSYYDDKPLKKVDANTYIYYMPEAILTASTPWGTGDHKPVNYFVIKTTGGTEYEIPILTYGGDTPITDYLKFARGEETNKPDYSVFRNHYYRYLIRNLSVPTIEIFYNVLEWQVVSKSTFMGYWYNVEVEGDEITIQNTVKACPPHNVKLVTVDPYKFSDNTTEKEFTNEAPDASVTYKLNAVPAAGDPYLEVYYNDILVKTFIK
ncbi:fimbrial protein [Parabacteroides sp. Marseille-P3160]|uniref:fimbrial protein n=1 Tax=Parabacteroides sp. Marseille-P3160 TaxID=1917887 RepID=UPI0009B9E93D|nr:fimbrial protein [Parabacteroides sp. Marseille-P3160]